MEIVLGVLPIDLTVKELALKDGCRLKDLGLWMTSTAGGASTQIDTLSGSLGELLDMPSDRVSTVRLNKYWAYEDYSAGTQSLDIVGFTDGSVMIDGPCQKSGAGVAPAGETASHQHHDERDQERTPTTQTPPSPRRSTPQQQQQQQQQPTIVVSYNNNFQAPEFQPEDHQTQYQGHATVDNNISQMIISTASAAPQTTTSHRAPALTTFYTSSRDSFSLDTVTSGSNIMTARDDPNDSQIDIHHQEQQHQQRQQRSQNSGRGPPAIPPKPPAAQLQKTLSSDEHGGYAHVLSAQQRRLIAAGAASGSQSSAVTSDAATAIPSVNVQRMEFQAASDGRHHSIDEATLRHEHRQHIQHQHINKHIQHQHMAAQDAVFAQGAGTANNDHATRKQPTMATQPPSDADMRALNDILVETGAIGPGETVVHPAGFGMEHNVSGGREQQRQHMLRPLPEVRLLRSSTSPSTSQLEDDGSAERDHSNRFVQQEQQQHQQYQHHQQRSLPQQQSFTTDGGILPHRAFNDRNSSLKMALATPANSRSACARIRSNQGLQLELGPDNAPAAEPIGDTPTSEIMTPPDSCPHCAILRSDPDTTDLLYPCRAYDSELDDEDMSAEGSDGAGGIYDNHPIPSEPVHTFQDEIEQPTSSGGPVTPRTSQLFLSGNNRILPPNNEHLSKDKRNQQQQSCDISRDEMLIHNKTKRFSGSFDEPNLRRLHQPPTPPQRTIVPNYSSLPKTKGNKNKGVVYPLTGSRQPDSRFHEQGQISPHHNVSVDQDPSCSGTTGRQYIGIALDRAADRRASPSGPPPLAKSDSCRSYNPSPDTVVLPGGTTIVRYSIMGDRQSKSVTPSPAAGEPLSLRSPYNDEDNDVIDVACDSGGEGHHSIHDTGRLQRHYSSSVEPPLVKPTKSVTICDIPIGDSSKPGTSSYQWDEEEENYFVSKGIVARTSGVNQQSREDTSRFGHYGGGFSCDSGDDLGYGFSKDNHSVSPMPGAKPGGTERSSRPLCRSGGRSVAFDTDTRTKSLPSLNGGGSSEQGPSRSGGGQETTGTKRSKSALPVTSSRKSNNPLTNFILKVRRLRITMTPETTV